MSASTPKSGGSFKELAVETLILTGAVAIIAAAVYFFLVPSQTSVSSISGLGIVLSNFMPLPLSAITMILNVVLLIIGFFTCGKEFGIKTVYTSILLPLFLGFFEKIFPDFGSMTGSQELDVLCYILVVSIGLSILFNRNASSGGLDIVAKIMNCLLYTSNQDQTFFFLPVDFFKAFDKHGKTPQINTGFRLVKDAYFVGFGKNGGNLQTFHLPSGKRAVQLAVQIIFGT